MTNIDTLDAWVIGYGGSLDEPDPTLIPGVFKG
jgi:hypothetical protein